MKTHIYYYVFWNLLEWIWAIIHTHMRKKLTQSEFRWQTSERQRVPAKEDCFAGNNKLHLWNQQLLQKNYCTLRKNVCNKFFYVPQPRKLVFPLQLRVKQCCIFRYRGIQCRNWTAHVHYSLTAECNLFLILLLLTSSSYSVSTDYYTRSIKSKWPGLVANLRPLRTTSAANNYNKY